MNHGAAVMSDKDKGVNGPDDATERELIDMEFESMVEGLSLDESAPTSYLDELDNFVDENKFKAPNPPHKSIKETIRAAIASVNKWKNGKDFRDGDGVAL
ncbi:hypothetical protein MCEPAE42_00870 [Candidatus Nanopelagicaceae bacterium]